MLLSTRIIATNEVTWATAGGSLSADDAPLTDRAPASRVALTWANGSQTSSTTVGLIATCDVTPRVIAMLGTDLPAGLKIELWGQRTSDASPTYALGGNSLTQTITTFTDGSRGAWWALDDGLGPLEKLELRLYNDISGSTALAASQELHIGEIVIAEAIAIDSEADWTFAHQDPSTVRRTLAGQTDRVPRTGYRTLTFTPAYGDDAAVRAGGLDGTDWDHVLANLRANPYCLAIPRHSTAADVQKTAIFGIATKIPDIAHQAGPIYQPSAITIEEIPA